MSVEYFVLTRTYLVLKKKKKIALDYSIVNNSYCLIEFLRRILITFFIEIKLIKCLYSSSIDVNIITQTL